jgi:hypothetical protein
MDSKIDFIYHPLKSPSSIRLIELQPGGFDDPLECRLVESSIEGKIPYEAISYVWGDVKDLTAITCDNGILNITKNLAGALQIFRLSKQTRILWADSICINQQDIFERNSQVLLMADLYRNAEEVLIWLGPADEHTDLAFECINMLLERVLPRIEELNHWEDSGKVRDGKSRQPRTSEELSTHFDIPLADSQEFVAATNLFCRPWFSRAWTFQESFLARKKLFICGPWLISGTAMFQFWNILHRLKSFTHDTRYVSTQSTLRLSMMIVGKSLWMQSGQNFYCTLPALLDSRRCSGCKFTSDLVYSILGAASDELRIVPDYSHSFERVFAETAAQIIKSSGTSLIFSQIGLLYSRLTTLPTWVPDWRSEISGPSQFSSQNGSLYASTGSSKAIVHLSQDAKELQLQGILFDTISAVHSYSSEPENVVEFMRELEQYSAYYKPTGESFENALNRVSCADCKIFDIEGHHTRWDEDSSDEFTRSILEIESGKESVRSKAFFTALANYARYSSILITLNKRLGKVLDNAQPGDVIALLLGGELPTVLRPDSDGKYIFVSQCYLHGFMDGEGLVEARRVAQPDYDTRDTSWLRHLDTEPFPFETQTFVIK